MGNPLSKTETQNIDRAVIICAVKFFLLIATPLILVAISGHLLDRRHEYLKWQNSQVELLTTIKVEIAGYLYEALSDLLVLADDPELFQANPESNGKLADRLTRLARISRSYHQLRYIGSDGTEIVRVNFVDGIAKLVPKENLQNKSHRPYFKAAIKMNTDEVFISKLDLNVEHKKIEKPIRPVIRFATPLFDRKNNRTGILVLNYLGEKLLRKFSLLDRNGENRLLLLNEHGYYLYSNRSSDTWGFQLPNRPKFSDDYQHWPDISASDSGYIFTSKGLIAYDTLSQLNKKDQSWLKHYTPLAKTNVQTEEKPWRIISITENAVLFGGAHDRLRFVIYSLSTILLLLVPVSLAWGKTRVQKRKLAQRDQLYARMVEQSDELIYITDSSGIIQYANPSVEKHTGYKLGELEDKNPSIFKSGRQTDEFYRQLWQTIQDGKRFNGIFINKRKDGSIFYEAKTISPLFEGNTIQYFVSTGRDVSINRNLHERNMRVVKTMAGGLAHHFGNMLSVISGFSHLMLNGEVNGTNSHFSEYIREIATSSKMAEKLLGDIRVIARSRLGPMSATELPSLRTAIENWHHSLSDQSLASTQLMRIPKVICHEESIVLAVRALLNNAQDAVDRGGSITAGLREKNIENEVCATCGEPLSGNYAEIFVANTGGGIPDEIQKQMWDPFFTTKESSKLVGATPGLGLSAVRAIIHNNNGHIYINSIEKKSTTISLLLPLKYEQEISGLARPHRRDVSRQDVDSNS